VFCYQVFKHRVKATYLDLAYRAIQVHSSCRLIFVFLNLCWLGLDTLNVLNLPSESQAVVHPQLDELFQFFRFGHQSAVERIKTIKLSPPIANTMAGNRLTTHCKRPLILPAMLITVFMTITRS